MHPIHHIVCTDGDSVQFLDYGELGITVSVKYAGQTFDVGFGTEEIPALIGWLTTVQKNLKG